MRRTLNLLGGLLFAVGLGGLALMMIVSLTALIEEVTGNSVLAVPLAATARDAAASIQAAASTSAPAQVRPAAISIQRSGSGQPAELNPLTAEATIAAPTATPLPPIGPTDTPKPRPTPTPEPRLSITGLRIASIGLETKVVPAGFVEGSGGGSWEVPAFVAGHAELTAGAGATGNAVLLGHVDSLRSGDVFHELSRVSIGDTLEVWSENRRFDYQVVAVWSVSRTDGTVMQPTPRPSLSVMTCTGQWLPLERDFSHRLVVRAELVRRY